jgi:hypothetical protein
VCSSAWNSQKSTARPPVTRQTCTSGEDQDWRVTFGRHRAQHDDPLARGEDVLDVDGERPAGQLHGPGEEAADLAVALVRTGQRAGSRHVPGDLGVQHLEDGGQVGAREGVVAAPDEFGVLSGHRGSPSLRW